MSYFFSKLDRKINKKYRSF